MKRLFYTVKVIGNHPFVFSLLFCGLVIFLVFSNTVITDFDIRFQLATKYLAWGTAFLSSILMAYSFRPEDSTQIEMEAGLPTCFYKSAGLKIVICNLLIVIPVIGAIILIANLTHHIFDSSLVHALIMLISNAFFFGSVAILGTSLGRRSVVGILSGLLFTVVFSLLPLPDSVHPFLQDINAAHYSNLAPTFYLIAGIAMFVISLIVLKDIDSLLTGKVIFNFLSKKNIKQSDNRYLALVEMGVKKILSNSMPVFIMGAVYEAIQWMISGWLPIMMGGIIIILGTLVFWGEDKLYVLAIDFPRSIIMVSLMLLPPIVCDSIPFDKRSSRTSIILSCISAQVYIAQKIIGVWIAIFTILIITTLPFFIILYLVAFAGSPQYLITAMTVFLLAIVPFFVYISSLSVLFGTLANRQPAFAIGAVISITAFIAYALTSNSIIGNFLFPSGTIVIETMGDWLSKQVGVFFFSINEKITAPFYLLLLPFSVCATQVALIWQLIMHQLENGDK